MRKPKYDESIFVNCPFDKEYTSILNAVLFAIFDCGFVPRCTKEIDDASVIRIESIFKLIDSSRYGIHDISRTEVGPDHNLPRFNMPLELGIFLGSKKFGGKKHSTKACLILDRKSYRYQKFISDIGGQDIESHGNQPKKALIKVRVNYGTLLTRLTNSRCSFTSVLSHLHTIIIKWDADKKISFRTQIWKKDCYQQVSFEPSPCFWKGKISLVREVFVKWCHILVSDYSY